MPSRYAFAGSGPRFHVLALPAANSGRNPAWAMDQGTSSDRYVPLTLTDAVPRTVVVEIAGSPVPGARVGVFRPGPEGPRALQLIETDRAGEARVGLGDGCLVTVESAGLAPAAKTAGNADPLRFELQLGR